jgi:hypothetical protein
MKGIEHSSETVIFKTTNLSVLKKLLGEASDLTEQLESKLQAINDFEIEVELESESVG